MNDPIQELHDLYCSITKRSVRRVIHERVYSDFLEKGFTSDDLRVVLEYLLSENRKGAKWSTFHDKIFDFEYRHFDSILSEARARQRNRVKVANPAQRVVEQFRNTKTVTEQAPAKSVGQLLRELP